MALCSLPAAGATATAQYRVVFESTWSSGTHPVQFPPGAHYSDLIGTTHDAAVGFWRAGALASAGIERMAEAGSSSPFDSEVATAIANGHARQFLSTPGFRSPGSLSMDFTADLAMPLVTLVAMLAPSPDWFVGVDSLPLMENGDWVEGRQVVLHAWDAGTDSGTTYTSANQDTRPAQPIARLVNSTVGNGTAVGTLTFTRLDSTPPEPLALGEGRFEIDVSWQTPTGTQGFGKGIELTRDTGYFWFFSQENVELVIKLLDACNGFDHFWVFLGGLTSVQARITVRDTASGQTRVYTNPLNTPFQPIQDTRAFATCP